MIYYENRSLFIHIPRTSGISICQAVLSQCCPHDTGLNVVLGHGIGRFHRHIQAHNLAGILRDWQILEKYAVVRNPWRICESFYRHVLQQHRDVDRIWASSQHRQFLTKASEMEFSQFVVWHFEFLRRGFFHHWCCSWETDSPLDVMAFRFEQLDDDWPKICRLLLIPQDTPRPRENASPRMELTWSEEAIAFIRDRCSLDFELFDYPEHP